MKFDQFVSMWWFVQEFKEERKKIKIKRKRKEKEKCQKEENKKGSHQILRSEMEGRNTALKKKKRLKKKMLNGNFKKS